MPATDDAARAASSPLSPRPAAPNPVLNAGDLGEDVAFVADPFLWIEGGTVDGDWHLFVEVYRPAADPPAAIAHLASADRGATWTPTGVVLEPDVHVAFPYVFAHAGAHYMLPDPWSERPGVAADFTLYRATEFPTDWRPVATPLALDVEVHDCVVVRHDARWWAIAGAGGERYVFYSDRLERDDWTPHADNPVVGGRPATARPAGRPIVRDDGLVVPVQDCTDRYGERVWADRITELTPERYRDSRPSTDPVLEPEGGWGWNSGRMHHLDAWLVGDRWLCVVDGNVGRGQGILGDHWAVGLYEQPL